MPTCGECGGTNPDGFRYCGECGARLDARGCPACGASHEQDQRFCGQCGFDLVSASLSAAAIPGPVEERKLATVLFADVVGFTSLAERTDPEVVARLVDAAFRQLAAVVVEHGGTIDKYMGDSLMAVFGVPVAHDDDAERAVAAALSMRKLGGDLVFSIGVNSGEVMATDIGRAGDATVIGDTVNVAARLEKAAGPGEVLCGGLTAELAGSRMMFRPRQPVLLKGKREPVEVWEAVGVRPEGGGGIGGVGGIGGTGGDAGADAPALVGRTDELAYLEAVWQRVRRDGRAQVVLLCGDAGSGKTRLAWELARCIEVDGDVVRTAYPAYGQLGGVHMAADVLRQLGPVGDLDIEARAWSLAGRTDASLRTIDPSGLEKEQQWGFLRLLETKAADRPLALFLDNMHRAADATLSLLGELAARIGESPLLFVLIGRSEPHDWLTRFPGSTTVRLGPLGRTDAARLAAALVCDKPLAAEASDFLVERAGGNPLYLRELVRVARAQGSLIDDGSCYRLGAAAAVPVSLQGLLAARLDALGTTQKRVYQYVAVLGDGSRPEQVAVLSSTPPDDALRALVDIGLLRMGVDGGFSTADPLLREVAYETLPRNVRGELHRRAAGIVTAPEDRARHLDRAAKYLEDDAVVSEAAETLASVGEDFLTETRFRDAERLLDRALELGCRRPSALLALARLREMHGDAAGVGEALGLIEDDPDDPAVAVERDHALARIRMFSDPEAARPELQEIATRWHELGRPVQEAWAIANAGVASFNLSRMEEASDDLLRALAIFEECGDRNGVIGTSSFLCLIRPADGRVPGWLAEALAFADETGDRTKQVSALIPLAWHHFLRSFWGGPGETADAERFAARLADTSEELGMLDMAIQGHGLLAIMARYSGRIQAASAEAATVTRLLQDQARDAWLGWAACFVVAVAEGAAQAAPPFPPPSVVEPVAAVAAMLIHTELLLAGRVDEALAARPGEPPDAETHGAVTDHLGLLCALDFLLSGHPDQARPWVVRSAEAARAMHARPGMVASAALRAELDRDPAGLPPAPAVASSIAELLVLRAHVALGEEGSVEALRRAATALAAPGLLAGLGV